jgi:hypothetical protein
LLFPGVVRTERESDHWTTCVLRFAMCGAISPLFPTPSWRAEGKFYLSQCNWR